MASMEGAQHPHQLEDLPDEVLLRVMAGAGSRAICSAAAASKRLRGVKTQLAGLQVFASASSTHTTFKTAVKEAADRACEGMLGTIDFAVLLVCGHRRSLKVPTPQLVKPDAGVAAILQQHLPKGVPVVGCTVDGLMSVDGQGKTLEVRTGTAANQGVAVLLGRMPGCVVRPVVDCCLSNIDTLRKIGQVESFLPWLAAYPPAQPDAFKLRSPRRRRIAGSSQDPPDGPDYVSKDIIDMLQPRSLWVFASPELYDVLHATDTDEPPESSDADPHIVHWVNAQQGEMVMAGGIAAAGSGAPSLFFAPGKYSVYQTGWRAAMMQEASFVALAICKEPPAQNTAASGSTAQAQSQGAGGRVPGNNWASDDVRAATASLLGLSPAKIKQWTANVFKSLDVDGPPHPAFVDFIQLSGGSLVDAETGNQAGADIVTEVRQMDSQELLNEHVALWRHDCVDGAGTSGCTQDIIQSGRALVLPLQEHDVCPMHAHMPMLLHMPPQLKPLLDHITELGPANFCGQVLAVSGSGAQAQLPVIGKALRDACTPDNIREGLLRDVYTCAQNNAQRHGSRSGAVSMAVFSCNGRIGHRFWNDKADQEQGHGCSEAAIIDQALQHQVPFLGGAFQGEIGPSTEGSWTGISTTPLARKNLTVETPAGGSAGAAPTSSVGSGVMLRLGAGCVHPESEGVRMHGYTSICGMIG